MELAWSRSYSEPLLTKKEFWTWYRRGPDHAPNCFFTKKKHFKHGTAVIRVTHKTVFLHQKTSFEHGNARIRITLKTVFYNKKRVLTMVRPWSGSRSKLVFMTKNEFWTWYGRDPDHVQNCFLQQKSSFEHGTAGIRITFKNGFYDKKRVLNMVRCVMAISCSKLGFYYKNRFDRDPSRGRAMLKTRFFVIKTSFERDPDHGRTMFKTRFLS